ncbi:MAG: aspartate kinase [Ignavibacteria bacterium]
MNIVVQKYGGSSVADTERIKNVANRIAGKIREGSKVIVVVSAMGKTTDNLIKLAKEITPNPDPREMDMLLSTGEQVSVSLLSIALSDMGIKSKSLNAFQAEIITTGNFTNARIKNFNKEKILSFMNSHDVLAVTGFQGITEDGELTTLGRGGSDTSAVALAAALGIDCEIFSDVAGIYTVDPKLYPAAKKVKQITYDEMLEMASLGAKVLHSRSVEIAKKFGIKIYCGSSFNNEEGSYVVDENEIIEQPVVTGMSVIANEAQVIIDKLPVDYTLVKKLFEKTAEAGMNVDMISIINHEQHLTISFTILEERKEQLESELNKVLSELKGWNIEYHLGFIKLSIVGIGMRSGIGVAYRFFKALENIPIKLVTTSEIKISSLIDENFKQEAVNALAKEFNL